MMLIDSSCLELPVGTEVQLLQEDPFSVANVAQIHEAAVDVSDVPDLLVFEKFVVRLITNAVILNLCILVFRFVLVHFILLHIQIVSLSLDLSVLFFAPTSSRTYM
jgi:hypothetical protein